MKKILLNVIFLLLVAPSVWAVDNPATVNLLTQQLAALKEQIATVKEGLQESKFISDEVYQVRDTLDAVFEEYESLRNQSVEDWNYLLRQYESLSNLQHLKDAKTFKEKYMILHNEVSLRFKRSGVKTGGELQQGNHETLIQLNSVDEELVRVDRQLEAVRRSTRNTSQSISTEAELINARASLETRKRQLLEDKARQDQVLGALEWDEDVAKFLNAGYRKGTDSISDNVVLAFIKFVLDPQYIYEAMGAVMLGVNFFLLFMAIFITFRMLQEGFSSIGGRPSIGLVFWDAIRSIKAYVVYVNAGLLIVVLMFASFEYFDSNLGVAYAHNLLSTLRVDMVKEANKEGLALQLLRTILNVTNIFNAAFMLVVYQAISVIYVFLSRIIDVLFAIFVVYVWSCGALATASEVLPKKFQLREGWLLSAYTIFLWGITEFLLVGILSFLIKAGGLWLKSYYGGMGDVLISALWYGFASVVMILIILVRLIAPFAAVKLASHQSVATAFGGAAAAVGAILGNNLAGRFVGQGDGQGDGAGGGGTGGTGPTRRGLMPDPQGTRTRDEWARKFNSVSEKVGDIAHAPMGDLYRAGKEKVADVLHGPRGEPLVHQLRPDSVAFPDVGPTNRAEGVSAQMQQLDDPSVQQDLAAQGWGSGPAADDADGASAADVLNDPKALADLQNAFGGRSDEEA